MKPLAGALAALTLSACAQASDCGFAPLKLVASPEAPTTFVGDGQHLQVRFVNENPDIAEPDSFPEPPVVLLDKASGKSCNIEDGGIWARDPLYLSHDEKRLVTYEFSGSNGELVAYDTATCKVLHRQDITGKRASIEGEELVLGADCDDTGNCKTHAKQPVQPFCKP
ncbi:hypothetical protein QYE80_24015 [Pseudomonas tohonis]|nr:hypothetical protein L682_28705 [Pseudomonas alcaligenes OT 69]MDN4148079.1 hypothetical protein [Pseudomonas tohonis]